MSHELTQSGYDVVKFASLKYNEKKIKPNIDEMCELKQ